MSIQVQRKHSGLPCAMARRLIRALPGDPAFLTPLPAEKRKLLRGRDADPEASGPHDFVVRRLTHRHAQPASTATCPDVSDDGRRPLFGGQDGGKLNLLYSEIKNYFENRKIFFPLPLWERVARIVDAS